MTDMQGMLFPPLDDEHDMDSSQEQPEVLTQEIKDRFSTVRSLLREKATAQEEEAELKRKQEEAALQAARAVQEEVARLQNGIAELEAMVARQQRQQEFRQFIGEEDEEISDSDDEEEEEDEQVGVVRNNNGIVFPALPSIINAVEPDSDADARSHEGSNAEASDRESGAVVATKDILCDA